jgi:hypothetical protein
MRILPQVGQRHESPPLAQREPILGAAVAPAAPLVSDDGGELVV